MDNQEIYNLIERIETEPSVLLLGQNYSSYEKNWSFLNSLRDELKLKKLLAVSSVYNMELEDEKINDAVKKASESAPIMPWLRKIMKMRWSAIYTTALDNCLDNPDVVGSLSFEYIDNKQKDFNKTFIDKTRLHLIKLCQKDDNNSVETNIRKLDNRINTQVPWIYKNMINRKGVFIIDGWTPDDSLGVETLLNIDGNFPYDRIFLFGMSYTDFMDFLKKSDEKTKVIKYISDDVKSGKIVLIDQSFPDVLDQCGFFDDEEEYSETYEGGTYYVTVKRTGKSKGRNQVFTVNKNELDSISKRITLIHDGLTESYVPDDTLKYDSDAFVQFLTQHDKINWGLYSGFYSRRKVDKELYEAIRYQLENTTSYTRHPILLCGPSNSGKTATLINLALKIKNQGLSKPAVVFYINGNPADDLLDIDNDWIKRLESLCRENILKKHSKADGPAVNIIIIWDNYSESKTSKYKDLQNRLSDCNALVVGSSYRKAVGMECKEISSILSDEEYNDYINKLDNINPDWSCYIRNRKKKEKDTAIFSILTKIALYENSSEWHLLKNLLKNNFEYEVRDVEDETGNAKIEFDSNLSNKFYSDDFEEFENHISKEGIGALKSLQLELELKEDENKKTETQDEKIQEAKRQAIDDIKLLNGLLATAGQFGLGLPSALITDILYRESEELYIKKLDRFITDVLKYDSLVVCEQDRNGDDYNVRFRHSSEADTYLSGNFPAEDERKKGEIEYLCLLIKYCDWNYDAEASNITQLIRKFGPNSTGKPEEEIRQGRSYTAYKPYWSDIIDMMNDISSINNYPEAILVKCHLIRENINKETQYPEELEAGLAALDEAQKELEDLLKNNDVSYMDISYAQRSRICGEICAGLNMKMQYALKKGNDLNIKDFLKIFEKFRTCFMDALNSYKKSVFWKNQKKYFGESGTGDDDAANILLDIWLNAVNNFKSATKDHYADAYKAEAQDHSLISYRATKDHYADAYKNLIADSLKYISELINIGESNDVSNLMAKIDNVFNEAKIILNNDAPSIEQYRQYCIKKKNDSYIFMRAFNYYFDNAAKNYKFNDNLEVAKKEKEILWFLNEEGAKNFNDEPDILLKLKECSKTAAQQTVDWFERPDNIKLAEKSDRCMYLYLKSKWLLETGNLLLEEKQKIALNKEKWQEFHEIYEKYKNSFVDKEPIPQPAALMIEAVYELVYGKTFKSGNPFSDLRLYTISAKSLQRIGICEESGKMLNLSVQISPYENNTNAAHGKIIGSFSPNNSFFENTHLKDRDRIPLTKKAVDRIFMGNKPININRYDKPLALWFTVRGPQLDICETED